jgi:hypothetical protein
MKTPLLLLVSLSVILGACSADDERSPLWGIDFSGENSSGFAMGSVDQFLDETKTTYIVKTANLRCAGGDVYTLLYTFESGEEMAITIVKKTIDYNYIFPGNEGENQLLSVTFNAETLGLAEGKVSIQPRTEENKLSTITKLLTVSNAVFNGAIGRVPLLK